MKIPKKSWLKRASIQDRQAAYSAYIRSLGIAGAFLTDTEKQVIIRRFKI